MLSKIHQKLIKRLEKSLEKLRRDRLFFQSLDNKNKLFLKGFSCNDQDLDHYLAKKAFKEQSGNFSRVFLGFNRKKELVSFFTLSTNSLASKNMPNKKGAPYDKTPVILVGRLAVGKNFQGQGFGRETLTEIIDKYLKICKLTGSVALIVNPYKKAIDFYKKYKFEEIIPKTDKGEKIDTLYLLTRTIIDSYNVL